MIGVILSGAKNLAGVNKELSTTRETLRFAQGDGASFAPLRLLEGITLEAARWQPEAPSPRPRGPACGCGANLAQDAPETRARSR
jgi:hypothetical protein